jgi:hypothetical protein
MIEPHAPSPPHPFPNSLSVQIPAMWQRGYDTMQIAEMFAPWIGREPKAAEPFVVKLFLLWKAEQRRRK